MVKRVSWLAALTVSLVVVMLSAAACAPFSTPTPAELIMNIRWQWTSVTNQTTSETTEVPGPQDFTVVFYDDGTLSGQADCNAFTGVYSQEDGYSINLDAVTSQACGETSLDHEYLELLDAIVAGGLDDAGDLAL